MLGVVTKASCAACACVCVCAFAAAVCVGVLVDKPMRLSSETQRLLADARAMARVLFWSSCNSSVRFRRLRPPLYPMSTVLQGAPIRSKSKKCVMLCCAPLHGTLSSWNSNTRSPCTRCQKLVLTHCLAYCARVVRLCMSSTSRPSSTSCLTTSHCLTRSTMSSNTTNWKRQSLPRRDTNSSTTLSACAENSVSHNSPTFATLVGGTVALNVHSSLATSTTTTPLVPVVSVTVVCVSSCRCGCCCGGHAITTSTLTATVTGHPMPSKAL